MIFQIVSDLHIEKEAPKNVSITDFLEPCAPNLILAGDIGSIYYWDQLRYFLKTCSTKFNKVYYIPGNHEFIHRRGFKLRSMKKLKRCLYRLRLKNVIILDNGIYDIEHYGYLYRIIGSVLWSPCESHCGISNQPMLNAIACLYIYEQLKECAEQNIIPIVITHYPPILEGTIQPNILKENEPYYGNHREDLLRMSNIWICGHTHHNFDLINNGTRLLSNQRGPHYSLVHDYKRRKIIRI